MFDAIGNMPLHPLVIHAVVIGIPLALLLAILFAVPVTRSWARWPLAIVALGSLAGTFVARASGAALRSSLGITSDTPLVGGLIDRHAQLASQLLLIMAVFTVLALASVLVVGRRGSEKRRALSSVLLVLLVVAGALAAFWVYRVGDIGSRAVWNPAGTTDYTVSQGR